MAKPKGTVKTTASKSKVTQKPQAYRSGGQPKKGMRRQKRPASNGSDDLESSEVDSEGPRARPRKKTRCDINDKENEEEVKEEDNEGEIEQVGNNAESEDVEQEQVSSQ
jgi:hypothetical protein